MSSCGLAVFPFRIVGDFKSRSADPHVNLPRRLREGIIKQLQDAPMYVSYYSEYLSSSNISPVCPSCSNTLTVSRVATSDSDTEPTNHFVCLTCPYQYPLNKRYFERRLLKRKEVDDIVGGASQWENASKTEVQCPNRNCGNREAFFYQLQIRSADEPMTSFYKVCFLYSLRQFESWLMRAVYEVCEGVAGVRRWMQILVACHGVFKE